MQKDLVFQFRLDKETREMLEVLALHNQRKAGDVVRVLIRREAEKLPALVPVVRQTSLREGVTAK